MKVSFIVPGEPVGKGRPKVSTRGGRFAQLYTPEKTASYESKVALAGHQAMNGLPLIEGPVRVDLDIDLSIPQSWSKIKQLKAFRGEIMPTKKPDADNVIKAIFDGLNGVVWNDDVQVVDIIMRKRYSITPGVAVKIEALAGEVL